MHDRRGHDHVPVTRRLALAIALPLARTFGAVALIAACGTVSPTLAPTSPSATSGATPVPTSVAVETQPPTPSPIPPSVAAPCAAADLKASHGLTEGAAGSRLTEVVLVSATTCSVDTFPVLGLRDAAGGALVGSIPTGSGRMDLVAGMAYVSAVRFANWCRDEPPFPLALELRLGAEALPVTGESFPDEGDMPPCNGEGVIPILEAGAWMPR